MTITVDKLDQAIRQGLADAQAHNAFDHIPTITAHLLPVLLPLIQDDSQPGPSMEEVKNEIKTLGIITRVGDGAVMQDGRPISNLVLVDALQSLWQESVTPLDPVVPPVGARRRTRKKAA